MCNSSSFASFFSIFFSSLYSFLPKLQFFSACSFLFCSLIWCIYGFFQNKHLLGFTLRFTSLFFCSTNLKFFFVRSVYLSLARAVFSILRLLDENLNTYFIFSVVSHKRHIRHIKCTVEDIWIHRNEWAIKPYPNGRTVVRAKEDLHTHIFTNIHLQLEQNELEIVTEIFFETRAREEPNRHTHTSNRTNERTNE